jgi:hypothetical protein
MVPQFLKAVLFLKKKNQKTLILWAMGVGAVKAHGPN